MLKNLENPKINQEIKHRVAYFLWKYLPEKYKEKFVRNCYEYFRNCGFRQDYQNFSRERVRFLLEEDPKTFKTFLRQNLATTYLIHHGGWYLNNIGWLLEMVESAWGAESLPLMAEVCKNPDLPKADYAFYRVFLGVFERHQSQAYEEELWKLTKHKSKQVRQFLAGVLAKTGATALPKAKALLYAKTADARQTAAMILAKIQSPEAKATLLEALNDEKSDDTRDVVVEALGDKFYQKLSPTQIKGFVLAAQARGKLETPAAPWLDEETLPALHFSDDLGLDKRLLTRYLLYRLGRAKTISPETESKMLLPLLLKGRVLLPKVQNQKRQYRYCRRPSPRRCRRSAGHRSQ